MNSKERHEARYMRRKKIRDEKKLKQTADARDFNKVFTFAHLYRSAQKCYKGVDWKASVQAHKARCGIKVMRKLREMRQGKFKMGKCPEFKIRERGRERTINSIGINDRVPQKCNSTYALKPTLHRDLIYDNYASQEGKGTSLARKRIKQMLAKHIRKYGMTGGVIVADLRHFFDSIKHSEVLKVMEKNNLDERLIEYNMKVIENGKSKVGLVLGSENSQDFAVSVPSRLDHYVLEKLHVEAYGRYMDDMIIVDPDYEYLKTVMKKLEEFAQKIGFTLNTVKSLIVRFGRQFTVLKRKYDFGKTGKIIVRPVRESLIRERRKLKKLVKKVDNGNIPYSTAYDSYQSWVSSISDTKCFKAKESVTKLYNALLIDIWAMAA